MMVLTTLAPGVEVDDVRSKTDATFAVAEDLKVME